MNHVSYFTPSLALLNLFSLYEFYSYVIYHTIVKYYQNYFDSKIPKSARPLFTYTKRRLYNKQRNIQLRAYRYILN